MTRTSAFTLVELLVVISVIAILASMLLPAISQVRASARTSICASSMRQLGMAVVGYTIDNDGQVPPSRFQGCAPVDLGFTAGSTVTWYHPSFAGSYFEAPQAVTGDFIPGTAPYPAPLRCPEDRVRKGSSSINGVSYGLNFYIAPYADGAIHVPTLWKNIKSIDSPRMSKKSRLVMLAETHEARYYPYGGGVWPSCPLQPPDSTTAWATWPSPNNAFARHRGGANFAYVDGHVAWCGNLTAELAAGNAIIGRIEDFQ